MKKEMLFGKPVCFFTELSYEQPENNEYNEEMEENAEIYYEYRELKSGSTEFGVAFHNVPYYPANIPAVKDSINVNVVGEGEYKLDESITYNDVVKAYNELIAKGIDIVDITAESIKEVLHKEEVKTL